MSLLYEDAINSNFQERMDLLIDCENMIQDRLAQNMPILQYRLEWVGIRFCKMCKTYQLFEKFHRNKSRKWGISTYCQSCSNGLQSNTGKYSNKYVCIFCDFNTSKKCNYKKHQTSLKHRKNLDKYLPFCENINNLIFNII